MWRKSNPRKVETNDELKNTRHCPNKNTSGLGMVLNVPSNSFLLSTLDPVPVIRYNQARDST